MKGVITVNDSRTIFAVNLKKYTSDLTERIDGCMDGRIAQSEDIIALANDLSSDGLARMIIQLCDDDKQIILSLVHRLKK